jgi:hypothetical protein
LLATKKRRALAERAVSENLSRTHIKNSIKELGTPIAGGHERRTVSRLEMC